MIGLVVTPILLRGLGANGFGAWTLALAVSGYVGMVELGLGVATIRYLAASLAVGDTEHASTIAASARTTYLGMACFGTVALTGLVLVPGVLVHTTGIASSRVRLSILVLGLGYLFSLATSVYPAIAVGAGRTDLGTTVSMACRIATAVAQGVAVRTSGSLVVLAIVTGVGGVVGTLAVRAVARRRFSEIDVRMRNASRAVSRMLLASGWRNSAIAVASVVAFQSDVLVVGAVLGSTAIAAYGIATRASIVVQVLSTRSTDVLIPTFAHATAVQDSRRTVTAFRESVMLSRAILLPSLIVLTAFGKPLLELWLTSVPPRAESVLLLLVLGLAVAAPGYSSFVLLTGMNRLTYLLVGSSIAAVANLGLSVLLTSRFGVVGPALGTLAAFAVWDMLILPRHVGSVLGIPWVPLCTAGLGSLAFPTLTASAVAGTLVIGLGWTSPGQGLAGTAIVGLAYATVLGATLNSDRRARYRRLLVGATRRGTPGD